MSTVSSMNMHLPNPLNPPLRPPPTMSNYPTQFHTIMTLPMPCPITSHLWAVTFRRSFERRIIVMIVTNWAINIPSAPLIPSPQPTQGPSFGDWTDSRQCYLSVLDVSSNCSSSWWWLLWCDICSVPSSALHICSSLCWQPFISPLS